MGATNHLSGELLEQRTGIKMTHVPYKGNAPAMMDVISGHITMMFDITGTANNFISADKVRALAITSRERNTALPNIPTMRESGVPDYEVGGWYAVFGPTVMPQELTDRYARAIRAALADPEFRSKLAEGGYELWSGSSRDLSERIQRESLLWANVTKNLKFD
jgi:tripartite-type tricarboxylate transporter receptor subunit TctC